MPSPEPEAINIAVCACDRRPCGWPDLAGALERNFWFSHSARMKREQYGSWRWLTSDPQRERSALSTLIRPGGGTMLVERLPDDGEKRYARLGLSVRNEAPSTLEIDLIRKALSALDLDTGALAAVDVLVRSVHLLKAPGPGFDVSHSDPGLPFSIFVSVPSGEKNAILRLAESVLHEAMHLQLSLIERAVPVVSDERVTGFSPWQMTDRPIGGLVHGLYVFKAIDDWLKIVGAACTAEAEKAYVAGRRRAIADEIETVRSLDGCGALTPYGIKLVRTLLRSETAEARN